MSSALYYVLIIVLAVGIVFVIKENRQRRAERAQYKQTLIKEETQEDIGVLDNMMVRPTSEPTETPKAGEK